jgi:hypothetical protein
MPQITVRDYLNTGRELSEAYQGMGLNDVLVDDSGGGYVAKPGYPVRRITGCERCIYNSGGAHTCGETK